MIKNWRTHLSYTRPTSGTLATALTLFVLTTSAAHAQFLQAPPKTQSVPTIMEITPVFTLNAAAPTQKQNGNSLGWTGKVGNGFGLLTAISLGNSPFDFETGAIYLNQISEREVSGSTLTQDTHNIQIPMVFRYNFDDKVSLGAGAYMAIANGHITTSHQGNVSTLSYSDAGIHNRDFGLLISARASLQIVPQFYFIVDGRYQHGLSNLANSPPGGPADVLNTRSMQAYLGLSYRFILF